MKNNKTIYHFVVDQSGSMAGLEGMVIESFNSQFNTLKQLKKEFPEQEFEVSLTYFEDEVTDLLLFQPIDSLKTITREDFKPGGLTALFDGIGRSIDAIRLKYENLILDDAASVVMVIITDGGENASKYYTKLAISQKIKQLEESGKWTFTFIGAGLDAVQVSQGLNLNRENVLSYDRQHFNGIMSDEMEQAARSYAQAKSQGRVKTTYMDEVTQKDKRDWNVN
jgi:Mg-chelatase subunit ChlD